MIIELLDGSKYDIADYSLTRLFHVIPSAELEHTTSNIDGLGDLITKSVIKQRTIEVEYVFQVKGIYDYYLLRDELNALFLRDEPFYIIFNREPYKRWLVKLSEGYRIPPNKTANTFTLKFRTVQKYAESIATTSSPIEWDADVWGWNDAIDWDDIPVYNFNTNEFTVQNLGNVKVDPREIMFKVTINAEAEQYLQITNLTTGDVYRYNGSLSNDDTLVLDRVQSFKNGVSVFAQTNKRLLTLAPGYNNIQVEGGTISSIVFDFRFPFK